MTGLAPERADRAIARVLAGGLDDWHDITATAVQYASRTGNSYQREVRIDATSADYSNPTLAVPFEACDRVPAIGEPAFIYAPEGAESRAVITGIDEDRRLVRFDPLPWDPPPE